MLSSLLKLTQSHYKTGRLSHIAVVAFGDMTVFLAFAILGKAEHGVTLWQALVRTALPFAAVWFSGSPWLGAYRASILHNPRTTAWKIPLIWFICGLIALFIRILLANRPWILAFTLVAIAVQGALLMSWRGVFMIFSHRLTRL
jgi:hypothetical protein